MNSPKFTCSFAIKAVGPGKYLGKFDVMNSNGDVVDETDQGSLHTSAVEALHAAEARARIVVAALEHARLVA